MRRRAKRRFCVYLELMNVNGERERESEGERREEAGGYIEENKITLLKNLTRSGY